MKITFYSNFLTHHQLPFCLEMVKKYGQDFKFVAIIKIPEERLKLGYEDMDPKYDFVVRAYENDEEYQKALKLAVDSDIVMMGSTSDKYIEERLKLDKLTFRYRERIFQLGIKTFLDFEKVKTIYNRHIKYRKNKNLYMLCASAYGANDFNKLRVYKNKIYKWGYFPENKKYNVEELINQKDNNEILEILWTGRFVEWKHPDYMVKLAEKLKQDGYKFKIKMLGNGVMFDKIKEDIRTKQLEEYVELLGAVESSKVSLYMEKANIFTFTSGREEGWGAVLNESMNAGCAVVANKYIGAAPFLVEDGVSGLLYTDFNGMYENVKKLLQDKELRKKLSTNAYKTIDEVWNSENATKKLIELFEGIYNNKQVNIKSGPASKAEPTK